MDLSAEQVRQLRLRSQGLRHDSRGNTKDPATVLNRVVAVQAQDPSAATLSIWARSNGLTATEVERALSEEHTIVRTWLMRGTLHMAAARDLGWLLPLLGPRFIRKTRRRYEDLGLDEPARRTSLSAIHEILSGRGPMTRSELVEHLAERGFPTEGQAGYHLMHHAGLRGLLCYGPEKGGEETFVLREEWAEIGPALPREEAHIELARRYLRAYAPAGPEDLAAWSGLTLTTSRAAFDALASQLVEISFAGEPLWLRSHQGEWLTDDLAGDLNVRLLPRFDTYLLGYRDRSLVVPQEFEKRVHPGGGILHPVVLVDGLAAGTWKMERKKARLDVSVEPFEDLEDKPIAMLEDQVRSLARFLETDGHLKLLPR